MYNKERNYLFMAECYCDGEKCYCDVAKGSKKFRSDEPRSNKGYTKFKMSNMKDRKSNPRNQARNNGHRSEKWD